MSILPQLVENRGTISSALGKALASEALSGRMEILDEAVELLHHESKNVRAGAAKIVKRGVVQVLEGRRIFAEFTVDENLRVGGHTSRASLSTNLDRVYSLFPVLEKRRLLIDVGLVFGSIGEPGVCIVKMVGHAATSSPTPSTSIDRVASAAALTSRRSIIRFTTS